MLAGKAWATYLGESIPKKLNRGNMYRISWDVQNDGKVTVSIEDPVYPYSWGMQPLRAAYANLKTFFYDWQTH